MITHAHKVPLVGVHKIAQFHVVGVVEISAGIVSSLNCGVVCRDKLLSLLHVLVNLNRFVGLAVNCAIFLEMQNFSQNDGNKSGEAVCDGVEFAHVHKL